MSASDKWPAEAAKVCKKALALCRETANEKGPAPKQCEEAEGLLAKEDPRGALLTAVKAMGLAVIDSKDDETLNKKLHLCLQSLKSMLRLFKQAGDESGEAHTQVAISRAHLMRNEDDAPGSVQKAAQEALAIFRRLHDDMGEVHAVEAMMDAHMQKAAGSPFEETQKNERNIGLQCGQDLVAIFQKISKRPEEAAATHKLCHAQMACSNYEESLAAAEGAIKIFRELKDVMGEADVMSTLVGVHGLAENMDEGLEDAANTAEEMVMLLQDENQSALAVGNALDIAGECEVNRKRYKEGVRYYSEALMVYKELGEKELACGTLYHMANTELTAKNANAALEHAEEMLKLAKEARLKSATATANAAVAKMTFKAFFQDVEARLPSMEDVRDPEMVEAESAKCNKVMDKGMKYLNAGCDLFDELGDVEGYDTTMAILDEVEKESQRLFSSVATPTETVITLGDGANEIGGDRYKNAKVKKTWDVLREQGEAEDSGDGASQGKGKGKGKGKSRK